MTRGVKAGTRRGHYNRFSKPRLKKMANDIRNGSFDRDAVAHVFEITGNLSNFLIAQAIRAGAEFNLNRLASALERLGNPVKPPTPGKVVPIWMEEAAIKHLNGMRLRDALGLNDSYSDHRKWRAYQRFIGAEYRANQRLRNVERKKRGEPDGRRLLKRNKPDIERALNTEWLERIPGQFPKLEQAIRDTLRGDGVPSEAYRAHVSCEFRKQVDLEILKKGVP